MATKALKEFWSDYTYSNPNQYYCRYDDCCEIPRGATKAVREYWSCNRRKPPFVKLAAFTGPGIYQQRVESCQPDRCPWSCPTSISVPFGSAT